MKLLLSVMNETEAAEAITGGADIIDVKNPLEGALGASYPWIIKRIREITPRHVLLSCTIGEAPDLSGSMSLAALGAASLGVNYVKVGLKGLKTHQKATILLENVIKAVKDFNPKIKVVAVGYADPENAGSIDPLLVPEVAFKVKADIAMIDTSVKDGKGLFDFLIIAQIKKFVKSAHDYGLEAALAGSLKKDNLKVVYGLGADITGLRGAACKNNDRVKGEITREKVIELVEEIKSAKKALGAIEG